MAEFWALVMGLSIIGFFVGLCLLPFARLRRRARAVVGIAFLMVCLSMYMHADAATKEARSQGFMDRKDQLAAADAGIKDPASWNAKKTELAEKSAREQAAAESERLAKESVKAEARAREEEKRKAEAALPAGVRSYRAFLADPGDIDRSLKSVEIIDQQGGPLKGSLVRVTYRDANATSGQALLFQAANVYQEVAKIVADSSSDASGIQFIVKVGVSDQYGQPQQEQIAVLLSLPGSELKKINWAKFTGWDMLNLSSVDTRSVGRSIAREFCAEESHAKYAARFCRSARK